MGEPAELRIPDFMTAPIDGAVPVPTLRATLVAEMPLIEPTNAARVCYAVPPGAAVLLATPFGPDTVETLLRCFLTLFVRLRSVWHAFFNAAESCCNGTHSGATSCIATSVIALSSA